MPLTDQELDELIKAGASDEEIAELDREAAGAPPPPKEEGPGMLGRLAGRTVRGALPTGLVEAFTNPELDNWQRASTFAGGVGQGAGTLAAALASGGGTLAGLGTRAAAGGAAKAAGAGGAIGAMAPVLEPIAETGGKIGRKVGELPYNPMLGPVSLLNLLPKDSPNRFINLAQQIPGAIGEAAGEALPLAPMMLLGKDLPKGLQKAPAPPNIPPAAAALQEAGGRLTPAMGATSPAGKGLLGRLEQAGRSNPLMSPLYSNVDAANARALATMADKRFGPGLLEAGAQPAVGEALGQSARAIVSKRAADYKPVMERLKAAGQPAPGAVTAEGAAQPPVGVPGLSPDFIQQVMGRLKDAKDIAVPNRAAFERAMSRLFEPGMDPQQVETAMKNLQNEYATAKGGVPGLMRGSDFEFGQMADAAKKAYYESLEAVQPGLGTALQEAKGDYAAASTALNPMTKAMKALQNEPEAVGPALLNSGSGSIKALLSWADENLPEVAQSVRSNLAKTILQEAKGSSKRLNTLLENNKDILPMLGEDGANLKQLADAARLAGQETLGVVNPSGTAGVVGSTAHGGLIGSALLGNPGPLIGKMAVDLGYTHGIPMAQRLGRAARGALYQPKLGAALDGPLTRERALVMSSALVNSRPR